MAQPTIQNEHAIETYKSLMQISVETLKLLALLNGGAAIALLGYLGKTSGKEQAVPDMQLPMGCYIGGLVFCALAYVLSYLTQLQLYNESMQRANSGRHKPLLWSAIGLATMSIAAFAIGSYLAVVRFR